MFKEELVLPLMTEFLKKDHDSCGRGYGEIIDEFI